MASSLDTKKQKRKRRKCSLCRKPGHTKRTCARRDILTKKTPAKPASDTFSVTKNNHNTEPNASCVVSQKKNVSKQITVYTDYSIDQSPHIVNLKDTSEQDNAENNDIWKQVKVYKEDGVKDNKTEVANFAKLVAKANATADSLPAKQTSQVIIEPHKKAISVADHGNNALAALLKERNIDISQSKKSRGFVAPSRQKRKRIGKVDIKLMSKKLYNHATQTVSTALLGLRKVNSMLAAPFVHIVQPIAWRRMAYSMVSLFLVVSLSFPLLGYYNKVQATGESVVHATTDGFMSLQSSTVAAFHANIDQAQVDLLHALSSFDHAQSVIEKEHHVLQYVASLLPIIGAKVESRQNILSAGQLVTLGNTYLIKGISMAQKGDKPMTDRLTILRQHLRSAIPQYEQALEALSGVQVSDVPVSYQQSFQEFKLLFATFINDMQDMVSLIDGLSKVFGSQDFKRYIVVFQNNREIRATGGFMGSFAVVDVQKGKILNIDVPGGGTYDVKGQLDTYQKPPLPMQLVNGRWEFHDANWWPDFPATAQKIEWFYEHSRGATVDGVIAINATVLERFLSVIGPVENAEYDVLLNADSALDTIQKEVEIDYDKEKNQPKAIIADLLEQFLSAITTIDKIDIVRLLTTLHDAAKEKEIQVYFNDAQVQKTFKEYGWTGEMFNIEPKQDYLYVVNTNLQGQKSDAKITQHIEHQAVVQPNGSVHVTTVIQRTHEGKPGEQFYGAANVNYMRMYVPKGAQLLDAGGFTYPPESVFHAPEPWYESDKQVENIQSNQTVHKETGTHIYTAFNKTVFGNWTITKPGQTSKVYVEYVLPFTINLNDTKKHATQSWYETVLQKEVKPAARYSLVVQKQSGVKSTFDSTIIFPEPWKPIWKSSQHTDLAINGAHTAVDLEEDMQFGFVVEKDE